MKSTHYLVIGLLWTAWCAGHSALISLGASRLVRRTMGRWFSAYRLLYNIFAAMTLLPLWLFSTGIDSPVVYGWHGPWQIARVAFLLTALLLFVAGARKYDLQTFLGIRQIRAGNSPTTLSVGGELDTSGVHGVIRHPWYLGALLFLWSWAGEVSVTVLIIQIILSIYLLVGTILEEHRLRKEFGGHYTDYCNSVSMMLPINWLLEGCGKKDENAVKRPKECWASMKICWTNRNF